MIQEDFEQHVVKLQNALLGFRLGKNLSLPILRYRIPMMYKVE